MPQTPTIKQPKALSVVARQDQPGLVVPFLQVLRCVAAGAGREAEQLHGAWRDVDAQARAMARAEGLGGGDDGADQPHTHHHHQQQKAAGGSGVDHSSSSSDKPAAFDDVRDYFLARLDQRRREEGLPGGPAPLAEPPCIVEEGDGAAAGEEEEGADGVTALEPDGGQPPPAAARKLLLPAPQLEQLESLWRRVHGAASLAGAAADAVAPLLLQRGLRAAVLAQEVASAALDALAAATEAAETESRLFDDLLSRGPGAALRPVRPETPKLLPAAAALWGPLLAALRASGSAPLLEAALDLLARLTALAGGQFMARRVRKEALPLLLRLLREGPAAAGRPEALLAAAAAPAGLAGGPGSDAGGGGGGAVLPAAPPLTAAGAVRSSVLLGLEPGTDAASTGAAGGSSGGGSGGGPEAAAGGYLSRAAQLMAPSSSIVVAASPDGGGASEGGALAPAAVSRVQTAVLNCLARICRCERSRGALAGAAWEVAAAAAPFLSEQHPLALREAAANLLAAAALADADAVWLLLFDLAASGGAPGAVLPPEPAAGGAGPPLPRLKQLLPPPPPGAAATSTRRGSVARQVGGGGGDGGAVTGELAAQCGPRAAALLEQLTAPGGACAAGAASWHAKAQQQLEVLDSYSTV
jgi:hypothetical protein